MPIYFLILYVDYLFSFYFMFIKLKTLFRNQMGQSLAFMYTYRNIHIDVNYIIDYFAKKTKEK